MSDIVIHNAKPPTNCFTCDYEKLTENCPCYIGICSASEYKDSRHPYCPLKEVPAEGNKWHIGTPTEEGDYLVKLDVEHHVYPYYVLKWANGWYSHYDMDYPACPKHRVIKWQKIEDTKG